MQKIKSDLYYGEISDYSPEEINNFKAMGFINGNKIIINAGTQILSKQNIGGACEYELKNNGNIIKLDLII